MGTDDEVARVRFLFFGGTAGDSVLGGACSAGETPGETPAVGAPVSTLNQSGESPHSGLDLTSIVEGNRVL
jgi:hypothetical protein